MYYVEIDLGQLCTRLAASGEWDAAGGADALIGWLNTSGFARCGVGWLADADAMNRLSCSEIIYSEGAPSVPGGVRPRVAFEQWRRQGRIAATAAAAWA